MPDRLPIPEVLAAKVGGFPADGGPDGATWLRALPALVEAVLDRWDLTVTGPAMSGWTALVLPVERDGVRLVCKIGWPHRDSAQEHLALRHWAGNGAVQLIAADPARRALVLEALDPGRDLGALRIDEACEVIGGLLARLHVPAPPNVRMLSRVADDWAEQLRRQDGVVPRRLVARALALIEDLAAAPDCNATLVHADLHFANVLAATREPWLAIDPHPMAGHPGIELHPVLRNRVAELGTGAALRASVRRRVEIVCDAAGIDEVTARLWTIVVSTMQALLAARSGATGRAGLNIALTKSLED